MKIIHIISNLNLGGAENFCVQLANTQSNDHEVQVLTLNATNKERSFIANLKPGVKLNELNWKKKYSLLQLIKLHSFLRVLKPAIVHVHLHNAYYYIFGVSVFLKKCRYIHTVHSSIDVWRPVLNITKQLRFLNNSITHVCISNSIYKEMRQTFPSLKSAHINNGINEVIPARSESERTDFWQQYAYKPECKLNFLAIGNIAHYKNFSLLTTAFKDLHKNYPDIKCIIIGAFSDKNEVDKLKSINAPNVFLAGPKENAAEFLINSNALLICSIQEGMPIVALEAFSLSKPILATPAGGMVDIVKDNFNGYLSNNFDVQNFKDVIIRFYNLNEDQRKIMESNAYNSFNENYNINNIAGQYEKLYLNENLS